MALPASSGQVARTPVFAKEHLGSGKIQEFFCYRAPKRCKDGPILIYSLPVGTSFACWWFWGDREYLCQLDPESGGSLAFQCWLSSLPRQPWILPRFPESVLGESTLSIPSWLAE